MSNYLIGRTPSQTGKMLDYLRRVGHRWDRITWRFKGGQIQCRILVSVPEKGG